MSAKHPILAITGASDSGVTVVRETLEAIFQEEQMNAFFLQGSGFHRYERREMYEVSRAARERGDVLSHFGIDGNLLDQLQTSFREYAESGECDYRYYLHREASAREYQQEVGTFTPWERYTEDSDLMVYYGLHGAVQTNKLDLDQYPDLKIGVVPNVNLEWMQRIRRDNARGYSMEEIKAITLDRMDAYARIVTPQFSRTHINFQMVPVVDTSDPFNLTGFPEDDECALVIHFQNLPYTDFIPLLQQLEGSEMTRRDTMLIPGPLKTKAIRLILTPLVRDLIQRSHEIKVH